MQQLFTVRSADRGLWRHFKSGRIAMAFLDDVVEEFGNLATVSSEWVEDNDNRLDTGYERLRLLAAAGEEFTTDVV